MQSVDLTKIVVAAIGLLGAIITTFVIPLLRSKLNSNWLDTLEHVASIGVYAANQRFTTEQWKEKKAYVQKMLTDQGYNIDMAIVDAAIESQVKAAKLAYSDTKDTEYGPLE